MAGGDCLVGCDALLDREDCFEALGSDEPVVLLCIASSLSAFGDLVFGGFLELGVLRG